MWSWKQNLTQINTAVSEKPEFTDVRPDSLRRDSKSADKV